MTQQPSSPQDLRPKNYIGSALLFVGIFSTATVAGLLILLTTPLPFIIRYNISKAWCSLVVWMSAFFCGLRYEVEGLENIDPQQPAIVLSNHQSAWETLALRHILPMQSVLLKRSLLMFPIWGWALGVVKSIAIDRNNQRAALRILLDKGTVYLNQGLWIVIFPEGTRTAAGEVKKFSAGGAMLAQKTSFPIIPVAHNAGDFWPRYSFLKYPGVIKVKIGPVISSKKRKAADINAEAEAWIAQAIKEL
ncbi:MAG: lysophospholipid acyltransferase family protein [Methylobacter sp.]|nr:lysophospholipid acyltransferase family protein [Methylobacter sp.]MDP2099896.1 lysophospholipid acyltransferase family protein [Methylobacter sp.]MDP2427455.1 lysophospholipid acyltransferase family protein [Methylobacter sp.]MDP3054540.1 lysophospholipid acyltransferase family protein [Methylobacter sp.]MDP3362145.1 lysophospholipid acyltransferase family protein [Methylobacter sp.]